MPTGKSGQQTSSTKRNVMLRLLTHLIDVMKGARVKVNLGINEMMAMESAFD